VLSEIGAISEQRIATLVDPALVLARAI